MQLKKIEIDVAKFDIIQKDIVMTLYFLEKCYPLSFFDIVVHLVVHLVQEVRLYEPI